jgi:hypothetical protein
MASSGISYLLVGIAAISVTFGSNEGGGGGKTEESMKWLMQQPFGSWLVMLAGLALIGIGGAQMWRARSGQWKKNIDLSGLASTLGWIRWQPFGLWLFIASALAIGVYGIYSGVQSLRYRFPED